MSTACLRFPLALALSFPIELRPINDLKIVNHFAKVALVSVFQETLIMCSGLDRFMYSCHLFSYSVVVVRWQVIIVVVKFNGRKRMAKQAKGWKNKTNIKQ